MAKNSASTSFYPFLAQSKIKKKIRPSSHQNKERKK